MTYAVVLRTQSSQIAYGSRFTIPTAHLPADTSGLEGDILLECSVVGHKSFSNSVPKCR